MSNEQIATNKEKLNNLVKFVGSIDKNVEELDGKFDKLNLEFTKLSTEIKVERREHDKVLSIRVWLIALLISTAGTIIGFFVK